jgi:hypothetical protein
MRKRTRAKCNDTEKYCPHCKKWRPRGDFWKHKSNTTGLRSFCRDCERIKKVGWKGSSRNKFGLSYEELEAKLDSQNRACAICGKAIGIGTGHLDHCHKNGSVRGFLCGTCNAGLGMFRDDAEIIRAAIVYLDSHRQVA